MDRKTRRTWVLVLLGVVALGVRAFRGWREVIANPDIMRFVDQMHGLARDPVGTMRGEVYHPLQAAVALGVHGVVGGMFVDERMGWIWALRIVGIVAGAMLAVQIARLARWFGAPFWASCAAGVVWMVGRRTSVYGADGLSDMLTWALFAESILQAMPAVQRLQRRGWGAGVGWRMAGAGLLAGLAYLARPEGVVAVLIVGATLGVLATCRERTGRRVWGRWFKVLPRRRLAMRGAVMAGVWMVAGFMVPAMPYMVTIGGFTGKKPLLARGEAGAGVVEQERAVAGIGGGAGVGAGAGMFAKGTAVRKVTDELQETFFWAPWLALLLAWPLKPRLWGRARLRVLAIVWIVIWDGVMYWLIGRAGYLDGRHTLPAILILHVLLALALAVWTRPMAWWMARRRADGAGWARLAAWQRWRGWPRACGVGVFVLAIVPGVILLGERPRGDKGNLREAAEFVRASARAEVVVCDQERLVGYYSGHPYALWDGFEGKAGDVRLEEVAAIGREHGGVPVMLGRVYYAGEEAILPAIGGYREVKRFASETARNKDVYVLYARPGDDWRK